MAMNFDWSQAIDDLQAVPEAGGPEVVQPYLGQMQNAENQRQGLMAGMPSGPMAGGLAGGYTDPGMYGAFPDMPGGMPGVQGMFPDMPPQGMFPDIPPRDPRRRGTLFGGLGSAMRSANRWAGRRMDDWRMDPRQDFLRGLGPVRRWADRFGRGINPWETREERERRAQPEAPPPPRPRPPSYQDKRRADRGQGISWYPDDLQMAWSPYGGGYWASMM